MKFIIDGKLWARGGGAGSGNLYNSATGKSCCVGLIGCQVGVNRKVMAAKGRTDMLPDGQERKFPAGLQGNGPDANEDRSCIYGINDCRNMKDEDRIKELTEQFNIRGIEVEFINV